MKSPYDIIIRPVLTEKSYDAMAEKKYTFEVAVDAGKTEIKMAIEQAFEGVKVDRVNTMHVKGKVKRQGRTQGRRPSRALRKKDSKGIEFFEGMAEPERLKPPPRALRGRRQWLGCGRQAANKLRKGRKPSYGHSSVQADFAPRGASCRF